MTNTFESSFVFRPDVRVVLHNVDRVEIRSGCPDRSYRCASPDSLFCLC